MEAGALRAPASLSRISVTASLLRLRSDEQLVAAFRSGNEAAFAVMHDRYRQRLFSYTRQMLGGSRQDAEDALQDVFLRAYSSLRASERPVSLRAWLYRVAHNRCIDHLRKPVAPYVDVFDTSRKPLHDPIVEAERREDLRQLVEDVGRLPEQQRSALLMREIDGLSYAELSDVLGVTLPAVKSLLVRARIGLVEAVEARDTACVDIRTNLIDALNRGVRASGRTRRHLRDCDSCTQYRAQLRGVSQGLSALTPGPGLLPGIAKLLGVGGAGSGAAAGASAGGGAAAAGGGAITTVAGGTAAKVAAIVAGAALTAGGAVEVRDRIAAPAKPAASAPVPDRAKAVSAAPATAPALRHRPGVAASSPAANREPRAATGAPADDSVISPHVEASGDPVARANDTTGGSTAPDEETGFGHGVDGLTPVPDVKPVVEETGPTPLPSGSAGTTGQPQAAPATGAGTSTGAAGSEPSSGGAKWAGGQAAGASP